MEEAIAQFIGRVLAYGGGGAVVAYAIFRFLGKKWIEGKFAERLETYKNDLTKELEHTRYEINLLFNRITKIHEKEFEILPEVWRKMQDALGIISNFVSLYQSYPNLNEMSQPALEEFLIKSRLYEFEKQELLQANDKVSYYGDRMFWRELRDAEEAFQDFHNYTNNNRVFLTRDLQEQFIKVDVIMWSAIVVRKNGHEANDSAMWGQANSIIKNEAEPISNTIEKLVQARLHYGDVK
jgi:hypothetical protein